MLGLVAIAAFVIRVFPFFLSGGVMATPADYDAAVYYSAAALLFHGVLPYRDFVFVHPPAALYVLGLTGNFIIARFLIAIIGAANAYLVGRIVGGRAGVVAAILYATHPDAVLAERAPLLEPILNFACLIGAFQWRTGAPPVRAAIAFATAAATKVLGGIWFIAAIVSDPRRALRIAIPTLIAGLALVAPLALFAPRAYITETLLFHSWRPPDGMIERSERLRAMFGGGHLVITALAVIALVSMFRGEVSREKRFFATATILTVIAFLAASSYWPQYNCYLAASECVLAGFGAELLLRKNVIGIAIVALHLLFAAPGLIETSPERSLDVVAVGNAIRAVLPPNASLFAFDPLWAIAGGRLPRVVDTYAAALIDAGKQKYPNVDDAFHSPNAQQKLRAQLSTSDFVILGWRGNREMSDETRAWFETHFDCVAPAPGSLCVWKRSDRETIRYVEGWYDPEGEPGRVWRWMGAKSTTSLPHVASRSHLDLDLYVPLDALHIPPTIAIEVDNRVIDRIVANMSEVKRAYDVDTPSSSTLTISTDRVVNPQKAGLSGDSRDLGVRLNALRWSTSSLR